MLDKGILHGGAYLPRSENGLTARIIHLFWRRRYSFDHPANGQ